MKLSDIADFKTKRVRRNYWPGTAYIYYVDDTWKDQDNNTLKMNPEASTGLDRDEMWELWTIDMLPPPEIPPPPWLVEVVPVVLSKHDNAESLSIAHIRGWTCVVKTSVFENVKLAAYIPPDSVVPDTPLFRDALGIPADKDVRSREFRVRAIKLRGVFSPGLLIPADPDWVEGENVCEKLGVIKYEPPEPSWNHGSKGLGGDCLPEDPLFPKYTKIQHWNNYPDIIQEGEEVNITEKIHGCLIYSSKITMSDGSLKKINKIKVGDQVLGTDASGKLVATKVTNVFNNGKNEDWLTVRGPRRNAGSGNYFFSVNCTKNHMFWSNGRYVPAEQLTIGSTVSLLRSEAGLTPIQEQVLIGKLLGDASLKILDSSAMITFGHKKEHEAYLDWSCKGLGELGSDYRYEAISGYGSLMIRTHSVCNGWIKNKFASFIQNDVKVVPAWVADELGPIAMAFWYMDDGSLSHQEDQEDRASFAVCGFTEKDCDVLIAALAKYNITAEYYLSEDKYSRLRLNSDDAEKLWLLIAPYIPPVMQYKLPERYRGHLGWLPNIAMVYKPSIVTQHITDIRPFKLKSCKYDIETETHNFFTNGILVHNSNWRAGIINGEFMVGSHNTRKKDMESSAFWQMAKAFDIEKKLRSFVLDYSKGDELIANSIAITLYGEVFGGNIQKILNYGMTKPTDHTLRLFDISVNGRYMDSTEFYTAAIFMELPVTPVLYQGPWKDQLIGLAEGDSFCKTHYKEGFVIKPLVNRWHPKLGRVILKRISQKYQLEKNGSDSH